jgi:hypothetical protein
MDPLGRRLFRMIETVAVRTTTHPSIIKAVLDLDKSKRRKWAHRFPLLLFPVPWILLAGRCPHVGRRPTRQQPPTRQTICCGHARFMPPPTTTTTLRENQDRPVHHDTTNGHDCTANIFYLAIAFCCNAQYLLYLCIALGTSFVVWTYVCLSAVVVVDAVVHHVGQETRTVQATTRSSDFADFILDPVFRRIPSPNCAPALLYNVLVRNVLMRSGKQSGGRAEAIPLYHGKHLSWSWHLRRRRHDCHSGRSVDHFLVIGRVRLIDRSIDRS